MYKPVKYQYPGAGRKIGRYIGAAAGLYNPAFAGIGSSVGGAVGNAAQYAIKRITGFGDYKISKNSLIYNRDAVPEFSHNNERCTMIKHREFICDIQASQQFVNREFRINPNIPTTFPWLSGIAQNYEQYVVQGLIFEYKTTSATAIGSTNTGLGTVILATQYNSLSPSFINKQQMENYEFCQSTVPSESVIHAIECDPTQTQCSGIFNMYDTMSVPGDIRLYDIGRFNLATVGMQAPEGDAPNPTIGELWVSYNICCLKPKLQGMNDVADGYFLTPGEITSGHPIGDHFTPFSGNDNFTSIGGSVNNQITINPAFVGLLQVEVTYYLSTPSGAWTGPQIGRLSGNITNITSTYTEIPNAGNFPSVATGQSNVFATAVGYFQCDGGYDDNGSPPVVTVFSMAGTGMTFSVGVLTIKSLPNGFQP